VQGRQCLAQALVALCTGWHAEHAALARWLAERLDPEDPVPEVRGALATWKRSPARVLSLLRKRLDTPVPEGAP
jgi:hypothetical protein